MSTRNTRRLVILDKNFLQSESRSTPRLSALARCGCDFVLIDTLIYEICSDLRLPNLWASIQRKLFPFADRLHVWRHSSELLREEVSRNSPIASPEDLESTQRIRSWFRSGEVYVPDDLTQSVARTRQQREIDSMEMVAPMAQSVGHLFAERTDIPPNSRSELASLVFDNLNDARLIQWAIRASHSTTEATESYIPQATSRIGANWFAYHVARMTLALIGIYLFKYGSDGEAGSKFTNTKLDLEYLVMLNYADALASDETSGDMSLMYSSLYGSSKKHITSAWLSTKLPNETGIRNQAYKLWELKGRHHEHAMEDWLDAEKELFDAAWTEL